MKKTFKKMLRLVIALALVIAMSITVFASGETGGETGDTPSTTTHTIKLTAKADQKETHTYSAYKVFAGTYDTESGQLKGITWGDGVNGDDLLTALKADTTVGTAFAGASNAVEAAAVISGFTSDSAEALAVANVIEKNLATATGSSSEEKSPYTIEVEGDGYYFIKDTTAALTEGDTYSTFMLQVIGDVDVTTKDSTTSSEKKVKDINDSTDTAAGELQDSADWDIGDKVPFQLKGTVADDYDKYEEYYFAFHDTEGDGLTFDATSSVVVKIDGTQVTTGFVVNTSPDDGHTFDVVFENLKTTAAHAGSVITVDYVSELNENAVIGQEGNPNTSKIEFSNNPNGEQEGTGTTPDDTVIVFTYRVNVDKVDENKEPLTGSEFTLYKKVADTGIAGAKKGSVIKTALLEGNNKIKADALEADSYYVIVDMVAGSAGTSFEFKGIDDGDYVLVETTIPTGYNAWPAEAFTVEATHTTSADIDPDTGKVDGTDDYVLTNLEGGDLFTDDNGTVTLEAEKADLNTTIVNESGSTLPETGGMGTTLFYVFGAILVLGGGVVLISRRRMEA